MEINTQYTGGYYAGYKSTTKTTTDSSFYGAAGINDTDYTINKMVSEKKHTESVTTKELYYQQINTSEAAGLAQADAGQEQLRSLGIGFLFIGDMGMGMSANEIVNGDSEDVIVRVKVAKGEDSFESFDVNLSEVNPKNASAIEMFAFCQYTDANGTGVDDRWGSWHALKEFSTSFGKTLEYSSLEEAANQKKDWTKALSESEYSITRESTNETISAADVLKMLKESIIEKHKLTPDNIRNEEDWRQMDDEQWDKLIEHIDKYIDDFKEELEHMEQIQEEAAMKAVADAPADMKAAAASKAMLNAVTNGIVGGGNESDEDYLEKMSWTYNMQTDNQVILGKAKMANEFAADMISKSQEMALTGDTSIGISETENVKECASLEDDGNKKVWTITAFGEDGIICTQCTVGGESRELWRLDYKNSGDAQKVWDFLARFDKDEDLKFAGSQKFWEDFLTGNVDYNTDNNK